MSDLVKSTVAETIHIFENTTKDILQYAENIVKNGQCYYQEERKREKINSVPKAEEFTQLFSPSHVDSIPWNVNGNRHFVIENHEGKWTNKIKDGWWFCLHSSSRKGFIGYLRISKCYGSYICIRDSCSKYTSGKGHNTMQFQNISKTSKICFH